MSDPAERIQLKRMQQLEKLLFAQQPSSNTVWRRCIIH